MPLLHRGGGHCAGPFLDDLPSALRISYGHGAGGEQSMAETRPKCTTRRGRAASSWPIRGARTSRAVGAMALSSCSRLRRKHVVRFVRAGRTR
jgi:hypothetical protein